MAEHNHRLISVIIPAHNESTTIGACLQAAFASKYAPFEVIVVDDGSTDDTAAIAGSFPCRLVRRGKRGGVSAARNAGARACGGEILFFTDADCLLAEDALARADAAIRESPGAVIGGTYTVQPVDESFYSLFQSILINWFETKRKEPDYIAAHAMVLEAEVFRKSGGFIESPTLGMAAGVEDVELSHRLRTAQHRLIMKPDILVRHHFGFNLTRSLRNAWKKSRIWTSYSIGNKDLLADSGVASVELKFNVASLFVCLCAAAAYGATGIKAFPLLILLFSLLNLLVNRGVLGAFFRHGGSVAFAAKAALYYTVLYPLPVGAGAMVSTARHFYGKLRETVLNTAPSQ